jgi:hypothetical protein
MKDSQHKTLLHLLRYSYHLLGKILRIRCRAHVQASLEPPLPPSLLLLLQACLIPFLHQQALVLLKELLIQPPNPWLLLGHRPRLPHH